MKLKKAILTTMLAGACAVAAFSFVGCGSDSTDKNSAGDTTQGNTQNGSDSNSDNGSQNNSSYQEDPQGLAFHLMDDGNYAVSVGTADLLSEIVIPSIHNGKSVTAILSSGFRGDGQYWPGSLTYTLKKLTIPASITTIGEHVIEELDAIEEIIFENPNGWQSKKLRWDDTAQRYNYVTVRDIPAERLSDPVAAIEELWNNSTCSLYRE